MAGGIIVVLTVLIAPKVLAAPYKATEKVFLLGVLGAFFIGVAALVIYT